MSSTTLSYEQYSIKYQTHTAYIYIKRKRSDNKPAMGTLCGLVVDKLAE